MKKDATKRATLGISPYRKNCGPSVHPTVVQVNDHSFFGDQDNLESPHHHTQPCTNLLMVSRNLPQPALLELFIPSSLPHSFLAKSAAMHAMYPSISDRTFPQEAETLRGFSISFSNSPQTQQFRQSDAKRPNTSIEPQEQLPAQSTLDTVPHDVSSNTFVRTRIHHRFPSQLSL